MAGEMERDNFVCSARLQTGVVCQITNEQSTGVSVKLILVQQMTRVSHMYISGECQYSRSHRFVFYAWQPSWDGSKGFKLCYEYDYVCMSVVQRP